MSEDPESSGERSASSADDGPSSSASGGPSPGGASPGGEGEPPAGDDPFGDDPFSQAQPENPFQGGASGENPFEGRQGPPDPGTSATGQLQFAWTMARTWIKDHQTASMLGAFAAGVFVGSYLRE